MTRGSTTGFVVVMVTASSRKEAQKIAEALLSKKLCACVNIIPGVRSFFHWQGKLDRAKEVLLVIKTKRSAYARLERTVRSLHSYTVPEVIALPIISGSSDYLKWVQKTVK